MVMSERLRSRWMRDAKRSCRTDIYMYLKDTLQLAATGKKSVERRKISAIFRSRKLIAAFVKVSPSVTETGCMCSSVDNVTGWE